ncbi:hypothetical protein PoB_000744100 [Plakobranchus ocellatus]|uniref:BZIP domain-containing protein n=1 Tax=Plakobranchus ocellatus TaxID=259542 RepID=A0AAV3YEW0_9GAST|nr:hypothetical protein PoB_000744100 [Plakobranchus ocellatus]
MIGSNLGFDQTEETIASKVLWSSIRKYGRNNIKARDRRQRRAARLKKESEQLRPVEINIIANDPKFESTFAPYQYPKKGSPEWWSLLIILVNGPKQKHRTENPERSCKLFA